MKKSFLIFLFLLVSLWSFAQTQQGVVKTRGRINSSGTVTHGKGISGATVTLGNGSSQVSGNNGTFSFVVSKGTYSLKNVQKQNFQLCDRDLLGRSRNYSTDTLEIAMQTPDEALEDRLESEEKIRATLTAQLNKQKEELRRLKEEQKLTQQEYYKKLQKLYDDLNNNEKFISEMAERYSTMDFDQMDEFQSKVAFYISNGELARADSLLNTKGSMDERSEEIDRARKVNAEEKADIARRQENLDKSEKQVEILVVDFAADCYSRYEICLLEHKNDSAAYWLELRASKDTLNVEWQLNAGVFISEYLADYEKAMGYFQLALANALNSFGDEHPAVASSYNNIGFIYDVQGDYVQALEYYSKALEIQKKVSGEEHPDVATSYNNIGCIYLYQGDYTLALEYYTKSLEILKEAFGEAHPDVASSYSNIGYIYDSKGDYARALEYDTKALEIRKKIFGDEHPDVANSYNNIGGIYYYQDDPVRALEYLTKALEIRKKIFGDEHPDVATVYNNIGYVYYDQDDFTRALEYHSKALEILKKVFGETYPDVEDTITRINEINDLIEGKKVDEQ